MAYRGIISPSKDCANHMLDCQHALIYKQEVKDQDCHSLQQTIQDLEMKCQKKDERILELENETCLLLTKCRENRESCDTKMSLKKDMSNIQTTAQSLESLLEVKKFLQLLNDPEAIQNLIKVYMCVYVCVCVCV